MSGVPGLGLAPVVAIVGPTAAGKTALSLALAEELDGEIINADSMQLYRGMDIGTAKITPAERGGVRHHALDLWEVTETASVAEYQTVARAAIDDVRSRGRVALLVGGSGLYLRAALERFEFPGTDPDVRARLEAELAEVGSVALHARLAAQDPVVADRILPTNGRRVVRALEVWEITGEPLTARLPDPTPVYPVVTIGVDRDPAELDQRIADRVERMWLLGLVDEVRRLEAHGLRDGLTASRALGYQQVLRQLDGLCPADQAKADTVVATRRFVRRQRSWFRRDTGVRWLNAASSDLVERAREVVRAPATTGHGAAHLR